MTARKTSSDVSKRREIESRWGRIVLQIVRNPNGTGTTTLVHRTISGMCVWDRKLRWARVEVPPGSPSSADPPTAVLAAVWAMSTVHERRDLGRLWESWLEEPPAPLEGPWGG